MHKDEQEEEDDGTSSISSQRGGANILLATNMHGVRGPSPHPILKAGRAYQFNSELLAIIPPKTAMMKRSHH